MEIIYKASSVILLLCIWVHQSESQNIVAKGCNGEADVIFLIDTSKNVTQRDFNNSKDFVRKLVSSLDINFNLTKVGVGITEVGAYAKINLFFYGDKRLLLNGIDNITRIAGVAQSLPGALRAIRNSMFTLQQGARNNVPDVLFIIAHDSIMYSYEADDELKNELQTTKESDIFVGMVLYGNEKTETWKMNRANSLVSQPVDENLIIVSDSGSLLLNSIVARTQRRLCLEIPACAGLADIAFVLDRTGSIGFDNWKTELFFVKNVVENLYIAPDGIRIAVVVYGMTSTLWFPLNAYHSKTSILKAVEEILYDEATETRTDLALEMVINEVFGTGSSNLGNRINVRDIAIVVTDGSSTDETQTRYKAQSARDRGIRMFAIGVKNDFDRNFQQELDIIGSDPDFDHVFQVSAFSNLEAIEDTLVRRTCREAPPNCTKAVDMVFAIDASGSITNENFQRVVNFVRDLVARLGVENGTARVGIVAFSDKPYLQFHLNRYNKVSDITRRISNIVYTQGTTMTADALNYVKNNMFTAQNGDRPNADNILLVITDGESNNQTATVEAARMLRDDDISILSLGVGSWVIPYELEGMASHPKVRNMFHVGNYETLFTATDILVSTVCDVVDDCVSNPCKNGGQCIDAMNQYYCKCATGYTGRDCDKSCTHKADIVFVLDSSGSIERQNFYIMQQFVQDIIHGVGVDNGARIGIVSFASNARVEFFLNEHNTTQTVLNAMNLRFTGGTTSTAEALRMLRDQMFIPSRGDRPDHINVGILLTDGKSNDRERTLQEAVETRKAGIHMSVIGVGSSIRPAELKGIATDPDDMNVYTVKDFNALTGIIETLLKDVCNENDECTPNPCKNGGTCLDGLGMYTCRCASGFTGKNCERACDNPMDIAFILDNSGSIQRENFVFLIQAMKELVDQLDIESGKVRIGLVSYNETATVVFDLNDYNNKEDIKYALDQIRFQGGKTNTSGAIRETRKSLFTSSAGDRQFVQILGKTQTVPNFAVLFTDGLPNINREDTVPAAIDVKIDGTHIILVTVGSGLTKGRNYIKLQGIPSDPTAANFFNVPKYRELERIVPDLANAMCNDVNECASSPCQNGGQCVDGLKSYSCVCAERYTGLNCERECLRQRDIVVLIDISGSIEENNGFDLERSFLKELIHGLDFTRGRTRVGFVTFSRTATTRFYLNTYVSGQAKQDILNAVIIDTVGFETNVSSAIEEATLNVFRASKGDRPGIENFMILVTDGKNTVATDEQTTNAATQAKQAGIKIYTVAIGETPNIGLLQKVASFPTNTYEHRLPKRSDVPETARRVLENICV